MCKKLLTCCFLFKKEAACESLVGLFSYFDKRDLACADIARFVTDDNLAVMLQPALLAQYIVDAGYCLVPFVVISISTQKQGCI